MTLHAMRGSSVTTTGSTWSTTANAYDGTAGSTPATYALWASTVSAASATIEVSGYNFALVLTGTETLASVTVTIRHKESSTVQVSSVSVQPFDGATAIGTPLVLAKSTAARTDTATFPVTMAQLRSSTFKVRVTAVRASGTGAGTFSLDYVDVTADVPSKAETLVDTFATQINPITWDTYNSPTIDAGRLKLTSLQAYSGIVSKATNYDLRESSVLVKVTPPAPAASREIILNVYAPGNPAGAFFLIYGAPGSQSLLFRNRYGSTNHDNYLTPYDPIAHAWLRIRLSGTTLYWETSPNGITWTTRFSATNTADLSRVQIELSCGQWQAEADTQPGYFDNLNVPGIPEGRAQVWTGTAWVRKPMKVWNGSAWVEKPVKKWTGSAWVPVT